MRGVYCSTQVMLYLIRQMHRAETNIEIQRDGIFAVPNAVGPLSYPKFLIRDWNPFFYKRKSSNRIEMEPQELERYRVMYAQFVEMAQGQKAANVTRASVIAANLDAAANNFNLLDGVLEKIVHNVTSLTKTTSKETGAITKPRDFIEEYIAQYYDEVGADDDEVDDDGETEEEATGTKEDDKHSGEENQDEADDEVEEEEKSQDNTDIPHPDTDESVDTSEFSSVQDSHCPKCAAVNTYDPQVQGSIMTTNPPLDQGQTRNSQGSAPSMSKDELIERPVKSRKSRFVQGVLGVVAKGCRVAAHKLHCKTSLEADEERICTNSPVATSKEKSMGNESEDDLKELLDHVASDLQQMARGRHVEHDDRVIEQAKGKAETEDAPLTGLQNGQQPSIPHPTIPEIQHSKARPKAIQNATPSDESETTEDLQPSGPTIKDAWDRIALEVKNCGIRDSTIVAQQPKIAGLIIDAMRGEQRRLDAVEEAEKTAKLKAEQKTNKESRARQARQALEVLETRGIETAVIKNEGKLQAPELEGDAPSKAGKALVHSRGINSSEAKQRGLSSDKLPKKRIYNERKVRIPKSQAKKQAVAARIPTMQKREYSRTIQHTGSELLVTNKQPTVGSEVISKHEKLEGPGVDAAGSGSNGLQGTREREAEATTNLPTQQPKTAAAPSNYVQIPLLGPDGKNISRSKPCLCGSGHKVKKCCGRARKPRVAEPTRDEESSPNQEKNGNHGEQVSSDSSFVEITPGMLGSIPLEASEKGASIENPQNHHTHAASASALTNNNHTSQCQQTLKLSPPAQTPDHTALHHSRHSLAPSDEEDEGIDTGAFTLGDICIALGKNSLDQNRYGRLEEGFKMLLHRQTGET